MGKPLCKWIHNICHVKKFTKSFVHEYLKAFFLIFKRRVVGNNYDNVDIVIP